MLSKEQKREKIASYLGAAIVFRDSLRADGLEAAADEADDLVKGLTDDLREFEFGRIDLNDIVYIGRAAA